MHKSDKHGIRTKRVLSLVVLLSLTFGTFRFFPGVPLIQESWYVICVLYLPVYFWKLFDEHKKLSIFEKYLIALVFIVPAISSVCSFREFGQPIVIGLLRQRVMTLMAVLLFCLRALRSRFFTLREVKAALLAMAWGTSALWIFMRSALNPANFVDYSDNPGFVGEGDISRFVLQEYFIIFGVFYYALRALRTGKSWNYLLALLLLAGAYNDVGGRQMTVALVLSFLFFVIRWTKLKRLIIVLPTLLMGMVVVLGLLYIVIPQAIENEVGQFQDAFLVVFTGETVENASAAGRIPQVLFATDGIVKHPLFGNGALSGQWGGGALTVIGERFYADDIGLIGAFYSFGFLGLILFCFQYGFVVRAVKDLPHVKNTAFIDALKGFLLYTVLDSIGTGMFVFHSATTLFFVMLLCSMAEVSRTVKANHALKTTSLPNQRSAVKR